MPVGCELKHRGIGMIVRNNEGKQVGGANKRVRGREAGKLEATTLPKGIKLANEKR